MRAVAQGPAGEIVHELRTAANPDVTGKVRLEALHSELPANGTDVTLITATIVDRDGVPVLTASRAISFSVYLDGEKGGGDLFGLGGVPGLVTLSGTGRIALRAGRKPGLLRVVAEGVALREGETFITLTPGDRTS